MRVLIYPTYEFLSHLDGDSSFILTRALAVELGKKKDFFVYWVVPERAIFDKAPIGYLPVREKVSGSRDQNEINRYECIDKFNPIDGEYPIDVVISNNAGKLYDYMSYYSLMNFKRDRTNMYIWDFSTKFEGDCEISNINRINLAAHSMAYSFATRNFFFSNYSKKKARDNVVKFCSPFLLDKFDMHSEVIPIAFDTEEIKKNQAPKDKKFSFYFGGRFTATKGGEKILSHYDYLYSYGRAIKIKVATPIASAKRLVDFLKERGQEIEVYEKLTTSEYQRIMSSCHVSIYHQSLKMFPAAPFEQLYAGLVVLFKDYGYEREILPPEYPYLYKTKEEAAALVRYVFENYDEAKRKIEYVKNWLEENVDRKKGIDNIAEKMRFDYDRSFTPKRIVRDVRDYVFTGQGISHQYIRRAIEERAEYKNLIWADKFGKKKGIMNSELYKKNIPLDYSDNCEREYPYYEKKI